MNSEISFSWTGYHTKDKEGRESLRVDERCGRSKEVNTPQLIGQRLGLGLRFLCWGFKGSSGRDSMGRGQWHFHQDNALVYNSILVTHYLTKMGINTVPPRPYSPDLAPWDFWLFPKLRGGRRYETIFSCLWTKWRNFRFLSPVITSFSPLCTPPRKDVILSFYFVLYLMKYIYIYIHIYHHHHHHVVAPVRISLTLSRLFPRSFIASGRSSGLHLVSSQSCCMQVLNHPDYPVGETYW